MTTNSNFDYKNSIQSSGKDIYEPIEIGDAAYWIPTIELEHLLNQGLRGISLTGLALRTRSKVVKEEVCKSLGYPIPKSFKKTQPRFIGQRLDIYTQKSLNLQVWNEELSPTRRYALIHITEDDVIGRIKVLNGQELALLDTTGKITIKYQARLDVRLEALELLSSNDTYPIQAHLRPGLLFDKNTSPVEEPESGMLLPIKEIFDRLSPLIGFSFNDPGKDQERNRGAALHRAVCQYLGYDSYEDNGQFPDIRHQLLEVKLQTSTTIDLGLVLPTSEGPLDIGQLARFHPRHCDTRYAIFYAVTDGTTVTLKNLFVVTGSDFFNRFRRFEGRISNGKIQIPLPRNFFEV